MSYNIGSAQELGDREDQQDAFGTSDRKAASFIKHAGVAAVVADGMGGLRYGREAAHTAVKQFVASYEQKGSHEGIPAALYRAILEANAAVVRFSESSGAEGHSAATLVAAVLYRDFLYWISAGDSRAYLIKAGGIFRLTVDHNFGTNLDDQVATGSLDRHEAEAHAERQSVTSCLGMPGQPLVDHNVHPFRLDAGDRVLLCSDGLYQALSEKQIADICSNGNVQWVCDSLGAAVLRRAIPQQDNCTMILLEWVSDQPVLSRFLGWWPRANSSTVAKRHAEGSHSIGGLG